MRIALAAGVAAATLAFVLPTAAAEARGCRYANATLGSASQAQLSRATRCLLNKQRARYHMRRFRASRPLTAVARRYAGRMVSAKDFSHVGPGGSTLLTRVEHTIPSEVSSFQAFGENLGWGDGRMATPRQLVKSWMHSPVHRANILTRGFDEIGIGIAGGAPVTGVRNAITYVTVFGNSAKRRRR
jgi:uncharacterized protein YkwD